MDVFRVTCIKVESDVEIREFVYFTVAEIFKNRAGVWFFASAEWVRGASSDATGFRRKGKPRDVVARRLGLWWWWHCRWYEQALMAWRGCSGWLNSDVDRPTVEWPAHCSKPVEMSCRRRRHDINRANSALPGRPAELSSDSVDAPAYLRASSTAPCSNHWRGGAAAAFIRTKLQPQQLFRKPIQSLRLRLHVSLLL